MSQDGRHIDVRGAAGEIVGALSLVPGLRHGLDDSILCMNISTARGADWAGLRNVCRYSCGVNRVRRSTCRVCGIASGFAAG